MKTNVAHKKKLKIAVLTRDYNRSGGGAERYCVELTERLSKIHDVHVFSQFNHEKSDDITFHSIPQWIRRPSFINRLLFSWLAKRKTKNKFDIIHSHVLAQYANIYTFHVPCIKTRWVQTKGVKKILLWLGTLLSPRKMAYLWLENKQMQPLLNRHFISVSEYLSRNILESYPRLDKHITIAHPGIEIQQANNKMTAELRQKFRQDYNIPTSAFVLLFVAHGFKRKGLPAIVKALENLNNKNIHIIIAGSGNPKEIQINSDIVKSNAHFIGVIKDMDRLYPVADAFIHPTLGDTYGMVVLEAMSHKLPVIVSNNKYCGFSEHLGIQDAIILESPRDENEISKSINDLRVNSNTRDKIAKSGYEKAIKITWEKTLEQTLKVIDLIDKSTKKL
jgi:UDP-glucose:(heptosyl)LPS alpha-1,3-glucosyltransferase